MQANDIEGFLMYGLITMRVESAVVTGITPKEQP